MTAHSVAGAGRTRVVPEGVRSGVGSRGVTPRTNLTLLVSESREKGVESWPARVGSESKECEYESLYGEYELVTNGLHDGERSQRD